MFIINFANSFKQQELGIMLVGAMARTLGDELFSVLEPDHWKAKVADVIF